MPSLDALAGDAGVSKGGLMHHFASRSALVSALITAAVDATDRELRDAATRGEVVDTWLRLSAQPEVDGTPLSTLAIIALGAHDDLGDAVQQILDATRQWEALIADEVGDPTRARIIRMVGDGMLLQSLLSPTPLSALSTRELLAALK
ncbi:TetR/AcrR family transcriptional regulator [Microcella humidisoli]|uniref:TetR/AcrR family transcriptional regulator n=1 Tax=Microcella humidisoli TaxID=2963406 RepID=A0ABY5G0G5_9MICO|nr:TetR/AcrR family transcriptional regulator [Microcella humidisoli]